MMSLENALKQAVGFAWLDLKSASTNLWRARKWGYRSEQIRHFERLVCVHLDHLWESQEALRAYQGAQATQTVNVAK